MRVEALRVGTGPTLDPFAEALLRHAGPAVGFLESAANLSVGASGTGSTPRALAEALARQQAGPRAAANALALAEGALAVVTGQQAGLLGGPLLSLHKAASAVALAKTLAERLRRPVVPVFWVASEDHDWAEANRATLLDTTGALTDLSLDVAGDLRSVRDVAIPDAAVDAVLARLAGALPATERAAAAVALATPGAGTDLGSWFALLLGRLLGDSGLVVVEPHVLAPWAGAAYAALVRDADAIGAAIRAAGTALLSKGLPAPLAMAPGAAPLFVRDGACGARRRVALDGDTVRLRGALAPMNREGLARLVEEEPHLASGDVVGRVFVQNALLPVVAIVGGPTECAYWAQVRGAHSALGRYFPAAAPRASATWVEAKSAAAVAAFGLAIGDVVSRRDAVPASAPSGDAVGARVAALQAGIADLERESADVPAAARHVGALRQSLDDLATLVRDAREEREGRGRARWKKAVDAIRPRGLPQERVLSPISIVARHGLDALRAGLAALDPLADGHQVVHLD